MIELHMYFSAKPKKIVILSSVFLKKKSIIAQILQGGDGSHSAFLLLSAVSINCRLRVSNVYTSLSTLNATFVHSFLMWQYKLQHTNSWSPRWEASWVRKEKESEESPWAAAQNTMCRSSPQSSLQGPGIPTASEHCSFAMEVVISQGNSKDQEASKSLAAKKDGVYILT